MSMKRNKWPEGELPEPIPDGSRIMTRTGYVCRVRRRGHVRIYREHVTVVEKNGKQVKEVYDKGEWQYYMVHSRKVGGVLKEFNGGQLFTHQQLVDYKVVLLREWQQEEQTTTGAQKEDETCQKQETASKTESQKPARSRSPGSTGPSGISSLALRVRAAAARRRC